jgi:hypothetical protein
MSCRIIRKFQNKGSPTPTRNFRCKSATAESVKVLYEQYNQYLIKDKMYSSLDEEEALLLFVHFTISVSVLFILPLASVAKSKKNACDGESTSAANKIAIKIVKSGNIRASLNVQICYRVKNFLATDANFHVSVRDPLGDRD